VDYCPECGKKMIHLKKRSAQTVTLILSCPKCRYEKQATRPNWAIKPIKNNRRENLIVIGKKEQKFRTTPTYVRTCPKCGNNRAYTWLVQLGSLEQSSTQFYRCTECSHTYRDSN
jgi:DNA-directed RNA polymerase subunit M